MYAVIGVVILLVMVFGGFAITGGALGPLFAAIADASFRSMLPGFEAPHAAELVACSFIAGAGFQAVLQALIAAGVNRIRQIGGNPP